MLLDLVYRHYPFAGETVTAGASLKVCIKPKQTIPVAQTSAGGFAATQELSTKTATCKGITTDRLHEEFSLLYA